MLSHTYQKSLLSILRWETEAQTVLASYKSEQNPHCFTYSSRRALYFNTDESQFATYWQVLFTHWLNGFFFIKYLWNRDSPWGRILVPRLLTSCRRTSHSACLLYLKLTINKHRPFGGRSPWYFELSPQMIKKLCFLSGLSWALKGWFVFGGKENTEPCWATLNPLISYHNRLVFSRRSLVRSHWQKWSISS